MSLDAMNKILFILTGILFISISSSAQSFSFDDDYKSATVDSLKLEDVSFSIFLGITGSRHNPGAYFGLFESGFGGNAGSVYGLTGSFRFQYSVDFPFFRQI